MVCVLAFPGISIEISSLLDIIICLSEGIFKPFVGENIIKIPVFIRFLAGNPNTSAYSASKFAVIGMSESLMKEVRKNNIRVCTLTPSTIASDMSIQLGIASKDSTETVLQPEDFAELIVSALQLPRRALLKNASLWSTNP